MNKLTQNSASVKSKSGRHNYCSEPLGSKNGSNFTNNPNSATLPGVPENKKPVQLLRPVNLKRKSEENHRSQPSQEPRIRLIPDLSAAALKTHQDKELALWYALRAINHWGSGSLPLAEAMAYLIDSFNYSQQTAYRHLYQGEGRFWAFSLKNRRTTIEIKGIKKVAEYLDTQLPQDKHFRAIPASQFSGQKQRKAQLYASTHKPKGIKANPISRQSIESYTGLSRIQQRRYEKELRIKRTANFPVVIEGDKVQPIKEVVFSGDKAYQVNKRLPNIYHTNQEAGSLGMLRKVRAELRGSLMSDEALPKKHYFKGIKSLLRCVRKGVRYYLVRNNKRLIKGRLEWCQVFS